MAFLFLLTASNAASLSRFSKSAPENPGVLFARYSKVMFLSNILFLACTFNISTLAFLSGRLTVTCLSNLPGLNNALSNTSGLFVAANTITPSLAAKPASHIFLQLNRGYHPLPLYTHRYRIKYCS